MAMYKRYEGSFVSIGSHVWKCQIWQEASGAFSSVGDLDFPARNPLVIEYSDTQKTDTICGSTATLKLISPTDRKYLDLYTITPGTIRLDVYRDDSLYWSGCLDPEHSEEPYSRSANYDVSLVFSDFGILKRLKYNLTGMQTLLSIMQDAVTRSKITTSAISQTYISTKVDNNTVCTLDKLSIRSDNFYDEEKKPSTLDEALRGIMQPLGLRMVQKSGSVHVYDLNGIYSAPTSQITWAAEDQRLSMDSVYNNVTVAFSPYGGGQLFEGPEYDGLYSEELVNFSSNDPTPTDGVEYYTYYEDYHYDSTHGYDYNGRSFSIFLKETAVKNAFYNKLAYTKYFKIQPLLEGSDDEGLAVYFYTGHHSKSPGGSVTRKCYPAAPVASAELFKTERIYLPPLSAADAAKYRIRINVDLLLDARYNPYTDASEDNEEDNQEWLSGIKCYSIPAVIKLYQTDGSYKYYSNKTVRSTSLTQGVKSLSEVLGEWKTGVVANDECSFYYYEKEWSEQGIGGKGWISPRQAMNFVKALPSSSIFAMDAGQYIPYPSEGGYLELALLAGVTSYNDRQLGEWTGSVGPGTTLSEFDDYLRWFLVRSPEIELVKSTLTSSDLDDDDVEYSGALNADALEELSISTICGTMSPAVPTARGMLYNSASAQPASTLIRAGRTSTPEQLLIGTVFSHHAERKDVLSGTMQLADGTLGLLTDAHLTGKKLLPMSEVQFIREEENEIRAVEIVADNYTT